MVYKDFITKVLEEASHIATNNFGNVSGVNKGNDNNQVLTETDVEIGKLFISHVEKEFPEHNIIDEEAGVIDKHSQYTWVIDPIDGTSNFANGVPTFGIMIGLLKDNKPVAGGIALPFFDEIYIAEKGLGALCNDLPIHATSEANLLSTLVAYAIDGHQENPSLTQKEAKILGEIVLGIRNLRASGCCFDTAMVAKGHYGGFLNQTSKIWDNVAPQILLEESGCRYTDFFGKEMNYSDPLQRVNDNFTCCAASAPLHKSLQEIIHKSIS